MVFRMHSGKLNRKISLLRYSPTTDSFGDVRETYTKFAEVWSSVKDLKGLQFIIANQVKSSIKTSFIIRYRQDVNGKDRVDFKGKIYEIVGEPVEIGRKEYLELMCREIEE